MNSSLSNVPVSRSKTKWPPTGAGHSSKISQARRSETCNACACDFFKTHDFDRASRILSINSEIIRPVYWSYVQLILSTSAINMGEY